MPNGEIQPEFTDHLKKVGDWLKLYGETIYGAKAGFIKPQEWGAVTQKGNKMYLHLLNVKENRFLIRLPDKIRSAKKFNDEPGSNINNCQIIILYLILPVLIKMKLIM